MTEYGFLEVLDLVKVNYNLHLYPKIVDICRGNSSTFDLSTALPCAKKLINFSTLISSFCDLDCYDSKTTKLISVTELVFEL